MDSTDQGSVAEAVRQRAERTLADLDERWNYERIESLLVEPMPNHDDPTYPETADESEDEFYPYAAGAVVVNDNAELLCVRNPVREWETPGGAGELDEVPAETARRETREETGIECEITGVLFARLMNVDLGGPEPLPIPVIVFTADPTGGSKLNEAEIKENPEITDLTWFSHDELPEEMREYSRKHDYLRSLATGSSTEQSS